MAINDWPEDDRPREKLLAKGPASLSDAELLAIFLRTGTKGKSAVDLARTLLAKFGSLAGLRSEKLLAKGPASLSDAELLAIFLRTGTKGKSAVDLARTLLAKFGSLAGL